MSTDFATHVRARRFVTDGGLETDLIFHHGLELPSFAAFPLVETAVGRAALTRYYDGYAAVAQAAGAGLLLEAPTWRANPDWGQRLGYHAADLARVNGESITFLTELGQRYASEMPATEVLVGGTIGPRIDGFGPAVRADVELARAYHQPQIDTFAASGVGIVGALTLTHEEEAIGIVRAARAAGVPVSIGFTVEVDGRLANGRALGAAIEAVDRVAPPDYFVLNCAHPTHIIPAITPGGGWLGRIQGLRCNSSTRSHQELDDAADLDEGDIGALIEGHAALMNALPAVTVVGGCCGTDARHVAALWNGPRT